MAWLSQFFGTGEKALQRNIKRATDKRALAPDRMQALEFLAEHNSEQALHGLLQRFLITCDKSIDDEQEKSWVYEQLLSRGHQILPVLRAHMKGADAISWSLRLLGELAIEDELYETVAELCLANDNSYVRDPSKKIQLLSFMGEHPDARMVPFLVNYLDDVDEGVRYAAVESLFSINLPEGCAEPLLNMAKGREPSRRIKGRIWEGFSAHGWKVSGTASEYEQALTQAFADGWVDGQKRVHLTKGKK